MTENDAGRRMKGLLVFLAVWFGVATIIGTLALMMGLPDGTVFGPENGADFIIGVMELGVGWYYARIVEKWYLARGVHND